MVLAAVMIPCSALAAPASGAVVQDFDPMSEVLLPSEEYIRPSRILRNAAIWARIDLIGPRATNIKLTVRTVEIGDALLFPERHFTVDQHRGVLYQYAAPTVPQFSSRGILSARDVLFFDVNGMFLSGHRLRPCTGSACPSVSPPAPAVYILEVGDHFILRNDVGTFWRLAIPRYTLTESAQLYRRPVIDRAAARRKEDLNRKISRDSADASLPAGYESLATLAQTVASTLRIADLRDAAMVDGQPNTALKAVYRSLKEATLRDRSLASTFLVRPTPKQDVFALIADSTTLLSDVLLDRNRNGAVDAHERPAAVGSLYTLSAFTDALQRPVLDTSVIGQTSLYIPVVDDRGDAVAVLGVVRRSGN